MDDTPERFEVRDVAPLKALAHPRRQRILDHLVRHGPATSASLARGLGLNTGTTSYHLRELARFGFVEETAGETGHGRERWWRHIPRDIRFPLRSQQGDEARAVMDEMSSQAFADDLDGFRRALETTDPTGPWADAFPYSRGLIRVTPEELHQFFEEYIAMVLRYNRPPEETPPDAAWVATRFLAYPAQDAPVAD